MTVEEDLPQLQRDLTGVESFIARTKDRIRNEFTIQKRPDCQELSYQGRPIDKLQELNSILESSIETQHNEAKLRIEEHIIEHMNETDGANNWIKRGVNHSNDTDCPFCGQSLDTNTLFDAYKEYFNEAFIRHDQSVKNALDRASALDPDSLQSILQIIESNQAAIHAYPEVEEAITHVADDHHFTHTTNSIKECISDLIELYDKINNDFLTKQKDKIESTHTSVLPIEVYNLDDVHQRLLGGIERYNSILARISESLYLFKKLSTSAQLNQELEKFQEDNATIKRKIDRIEKDDDCSRLIEMKVNISSLEEDIPRLESELENEQSHYLDVLFSKIDDLFKNFGSNDFSLERGEDNSGHKPVYYLKVKYKDVSIPESNLNKVLSESDRRALGLAVFWASLENLGSDELEKCIVVLDDPVTSFDDHRVNATNKKIIELSESCEQVIVLSHYRHGISSFIRTWRNEHTIKVLEISKNDQTSSIINVEHEEFLRTEHEAKREEIFSFIDRTTNTISGNLRVFLEQEISYRFAKQIREHAINNRNLSDRLQALKDHNIISPETYNRLDHWRECLNPEHHTWTGSDVDDKRNVAREFMDFLYTGLSPHIQAQSGSQS